MIDKPPKNQCVDCQVIFPILENFLLEARCPSCQAKYRFKESQKSNKDRAHHYKPKAKFNNIWAI